MQFPCSAAKAHTHVGKPARRIDNSNLYITALHEDPRTNQISYNILWNSGVPRGGQGGAVGPGRQVKGGRQNSKYIPGNFF